MVLLTPRSHEEPWMGESMFSLQTHVVVQRPFRLKALPPKHKKVKIKKYYKPLQAHFLGHLWNIFLGGL